MTICILVSLLHIIVKMDIPTMNTCCFEQAYLKTIVPFDYLFVVHRTLFPERYLVTSDEIDFPYLV